MKATQRTRFNGCKPSSMQLMLIATDHGYDTNPIGGFDKTALLEALNIDTSRYVLLFTCYR